MAWNLEGQTCFPRWPPNKLVKRRFMLCIHINLMLILYVREIEIKIHSFNCHVHLRHLRCPFCPIHVWYYQKCSQTMAKWNANESLISFRPKYLLKMMRYTVKNVIKDLDAGSAILETQNSNIFRGSIPPDPPGDVSSL